VSKFLSELCLVDISDKKWRLHEPLAYESDLLKDTVIVPVGFETDLASVPRVPIIYNLWGDRSHYEAVIHDYLYCLDSIPLVTFDRANMVFLEAMEARGKPWYIRRPMYWGVCLGGWPCYHKRMVRGC
jgi:hypothetical protein